MLKKQARVAQLDRAFGYEPKGREFESCHARIKKDRIFPVLFYLEIPDNELVEYYSQKAQEPKQEIDTLKTELNYVV